MNLFSSEFNVLGGALDVLTERHGVIASNIANVDTPGYKAKEINFKDAFKGALEKSGIAMKRSREDHMTAGSVQSSPSAFIREQINNSMRNDGNNVNVDNEMTQLAQNTIMFDMAVQMIGKRFEALKYTISEGRRS